MTDPVVAEEMTEEKENVKMAEEEETRTVPKPSEHDAVVDGSSAGTKRPADAQDVGSVEESEEEQQEMEEVDDGSKGEENEEELDEGTAARSNDEPIKPKTSIDITKRPVKRARSAYFVFADEQRAKVKEQNPGQGVAVVARALGQIWSNMSEDDKKPYYDTAAAERERVQADLAAWKAAGGDDSVVDDTNNKSSDSSGALTFPVARIRKICKLDPEVRGLSKESVLLITKAAELAVAKLAGETVKTAAIQNRRKLLPDDVAAVCANREQFLFLASDIQDLHKQQKAAAVAAKTAKAKSTNDETKSNIITNAKPLTDYFSSKAKS